MTWKVYEEANKRYQKLRRMRSYALAELERRRSAVPNSGTAKTKPQGGVVRSPVKDDTKPSSLDQ